jgi:opacity protein-like surface antigen
MTDRGGDIMKKLLTAGITFAALIATPAIAADMATKAPLYKAPPPVAVFSWTGCYLGASGGYAWGRSSTTTTIIDPVPNFATPAAQAAYNANMSPTLQPKGGVVGGQIGCNYQSGNFVFGAETDFSYFRLTDSVTTTVNPGGGASPLTPQSRPTGCGPPACGPASRSTGAVLRDRRRRSRQGELLPVQRLYGLQRPWRRLP